jgi:hypothetical protein
MKMRKLQLVLIIAVALLFVTATAVSAATPAQINTAINKGVIYLASQQQADGSFGNQGSYQGVAPTGLAVLKLEDFAIEQGKSPFDPSYQYSGNVQKGLDYIFKHVQADGSIMSDYTVYDTSIGLMAISESGAPGKIVSGTGNVNADGKTYKVIAQNAVNRLVASQSTNDGGWYYYTNEDDEAAPGFGDQSNTGYATLGLTYAQKFGISIPAGTLGGINKWVGFDQDPDGHSYYRVPGPYFWNWPNTYKTGSLLYQFKQVGVGSADPRVQKSLEYIQNHWNDNGVNQWDGGDQGWKGDEQAAFGLMKGFEAQGITSITVGGNPVDWYGDMADWMVTNQNADGSWAGEYWAASPVLSTSWALLVLEKTTAIPPPEFGVVKSASESSVASGGSVTYTYLVSNTGIVPISSIVLTDDKLGVIAGPASGDSNSNGILDPLETWTYTKDTTLTVTTTNTATAAGKDMAGAPLSSGKSNAVTVTVNGTVPSPEFPTLAVPVVMIIGMMFITYSIRKKE